MKKANDIALEEFQANYAEEFSNYTFETNEVYSFSETEVKSLTTKSPFSMIK